MKKFQAVFLTAMLGLSFGALAQHGGSCTLEELQSGYYNHLVCDGNAHEGTDFLQVLPIA